MIGFFGFLSLLTMGVMIAHMTRPRSTRILLSAARFFRDLPPARRRSRRWRLQNPFRSWPLYPQLLALALLLYIFWPWRAPQPSHTPVLGIWFLLDRSASMSVGDRMNAAQEDMAAILRKNAPRVEGACLRLSAFDLVREDLIETTRPDELMATAKNISPRALGTDLSLVQRARTEVVDAQPSSPCPITHLIILTDQPRPATFIDDAHANSTPSPTNTAVPTSTPRQAPFIDESRASEAPATSHPTIFWRTVGKPVPNVGFTAIEPMVAPLSRTITRVRVEVTTYGAPPSPLTWTLYGPDGNRMATQEIKTWADPPPVQRWSRTLEALPPGRYQMTLTPGDDYVYDDVVSILIPSGESLRVDWRLPTPWLDIPDWQQSSSKPDLRVISFQTPLPDDDIPTLVVGPGYESPARSPERIVYFLEDPILLADLNLDVVERVIPKAPAPSSDWLPVLLGHRGRVWLARRDDPPAIYVAGLPLLDPQTDTNHLTVSSLLFFNSVRWLIHRAPPPTLYTLTSPRQPQVDLVASRLALHPEEGNTLRTGTEALSKLPTLAPSSRLPQSLEVPPSFLILAVLIVVALERILSAWGYPSLLYPGLRFLSAPFRRLRPR